MASSSDHDYDDDDPSSKPSSGKKQNIEDMSLLSIADGENARGIPIVKFIEDVEDFANSFTPPASAELLIGAYSELHSKFKTFETSLNQKKQNYSIKIPDVEKSLTLVKTLQKKQEEGENAITRYNLCDSVYGKAEVDTSIGIVNLWLGANVMLEYTYQEAIDFLQQNLNNAQRESKLVDEDLAFVRDQIVTSEVSMSRIFNWDVRRKRAAAATINQAQPPTDTTATLPSAAAATSS
ncbi:prefoldin subunit domain containing protein [Nitzschia inconspicua]|uniref:Prefoldin subunit domain containing protein n=1 Tax=Nitzschia inconspicua TaxID=303405 RepID=A0A9K3KHU4_9STRA|nr:prefoldin subunit domain containing protein [Nitzschia inconspicua]